MILVESQELQDAPFIPIAASSSKLFVIRWKPVPLSRGQDAEHNSNLYSSLPGVENPYSWLLSARFHSVVFMFSELLHTDNVHGFANATFDM